MYTVCMGIKNKKTIYNRPININLNTKIGSIEEKYSQKQGKFSNMTVKEFLKEKKYSSLIEVFST